MIVKIGRAQITGEVIPASVRTQILNVVEKTEGDYAETLIELEFMEVVMTYEGDTFVTDSASEAGQGYRVYPGISAIDKLQDYKYAASDVISWLTPLTVVS